MLMDNVMNEFSVASDQMEKARQYHDKLLHIKREMHALHDKSAKLKVLVKIE